MSNTCQSLDKRQELKNRNLRKAKQKQRTYLNFPKLTVSIEDVFKRNKNPFKI